MKSIRVLVVEDDVMVAELNRQFTESCHDFIVTKVAYTGTDALKFIAENTVDLVVLDIYLPDMHGIEVLKNIRKNDYPVDILLITAAQDVETVEESIRFGVFDYIIKPFDIARYKKSLCSYRDYRKSLEAGGIVNQTQVDNVMAGANIKNAASDQLPKGINTATMELIKEALDSFKEEIKVDDICNNIPISRITVYRYLEYLSQRGVLEKNYRYQQRGRPQTVYTKK